MKSRLVACAAPFIPLHLKPLELGETQDWTFLDASLYVLPPMGLTQQQVGMVHFSSNEWTTFTEKRDIKQPKPERVYSNLVPRLERFLRSNELG